MVMNVVPVSAAPTGDPLTDAVLAARDAATWLDGELQGALPLEFFGSGDWGVTLDAASSLAAVVEVDGGDPASDATLTATLAAMIADRDTVVAPWGSDDPGRLAKAIFFTVQMGGDPRSLGEAPGDDIVARLLDTLRSADPDAGLFGEGSPTFDGATRQGLAMEALVAAGEPVPAEAVTWLLDQQCDDGSWMAHRDDTSTPCVADPESFTGPDSNSTAAGLLGLVAAGPGDATVRSAALDALDVLDSWASPEGSWGFFPGDGPDANSTAGVLRALNAWTSHPDGDDTAGALVPLAVADALVGFQLGCTADPEDAGTFGFLDATSPNLMATAQAAGVLVGLGGDLGAVAVEVDALDLDAGLTRCGDGGSTTSTTTSTTSSTTTSTTAPTTTTVAPGPEDQMTTTTGVSNGDTSGRGSDSGGSDRGAGVGAGAAESGRSGRTDTLARTGGSTDLVPVAVMSVAVGAGLLAVRSRNRRSAAL